MPFPSRRHGSMLSFFANLKNLLFPVNVLYFLLHSVCRKNVLHLPPLMHQCSHACHLLCLLSWWTILIPILLQNAPAVPLGHPLFLLKWIISTITCCLYYFHLHFPLSHSLFDPLESTKPLRLLSGSPLVFIWPNLGVFSQILSCSVFQYCTYLINSPIF